MSLTPTQPWKDAAAAGTAEPVLLFDLRPTVAYSEKSFRSDWNGGASLTNLDSNHYSHELRLAKSSTAFILNQEKQQKDYLFLYGVCYTQSGDKPPGNKYYKFSICQIVKFDRAFRFKKLYLGLYNKNNFFRGITRLSLITDLRDVREALTPENRRRVENKASALETVLAGGTKITEKEIDHSLDSHSVADGGPTIESDGLGNYWRILDFSDENLWIPGQKTIAITLEIDSLIDVEHLQIKGSTTRNTYPDGSLYFYNVENKLFIEMDGSLAFKFQAETYQATGSGIFEFDLAAAVGSGQTGEVELCYWEPPGSILQFQMRESASQAGLASATWKSITDGAGFVQRYVQLKPNFTATSDTLDTPRIYSMRLAIKASHKFLLASKPLWGYPNLIAEAPDYSAEGDPLAGEAKTTDTSRIVFLDPGGMISRFFDLYHLKNDEIGIKLGFNCSSVAETDFLDFKTLWIEDWEAQDGKVIFECYDQQVRFKEATAPVPADPPEDTEEIHFDSRTPAQIKEALLKLARIRPSKIDSANLASLGTAFPWSLNHAIDEPGVKLQKIAANLNKHLLAFEYVGENGKWLTRWIDFAAAVAATIPADDVLLRSEQYRPGLRYEANAAIVFYGGQGEKEEDYRGIAIDYDETSQKAYKQYSTDKILSEFIPTDADPKNPSAIPMTVARKRLNLLRCGYRQVFFSTRLAYAWLQIGDHVSLYSRFYTRAAATEPNPLLVILTSKTINGNLQAINWAGIVLLDNEQTASSAPVVNPPASLTVTPNNNGAVTWAWPKSADDTGAAGQKYELYQRLSNLEVWGKAKLIVTATGAASYTKADSAFDELVAYDFGVRFINENGRHSNITGSENVLLTAAALAPPGMYGWSMHPVVGGCEIYITTEVAGAHHYNIYTYKQGLYTLVGILPANAARRDAFVYTPEDPYPTTIYGRYFSFAISTVDSWGQEGTKCAPLSMSIIAQVDNSFTPSAPSFSTEGGTYPLITRNAILDGWAYTISLYVVCVATEADRILRYELERRDDQGSGKVSWSAWVRLPEYAVKVEDADIPAARIFIYSHTDRMLKPSWYYQFRVRAVSRANVPGAWSSSAEIQLSKDTTAPAQPTVAVTSLPLGNLLAITGGTEDDFLYFKIEGSSNGGTSWSELPVTGAKHKSNLFIHELPASGIAAAWRYRVTAYDKDGNTSTVSAATSDYNASKIAISVIAADTLIASNMGFTVIGTGNIIGTINASSEGITIGGAKLSITADTTFAADVLIKGILHSEGGLKSSTDDDRIEIGKWGAVNRDMLKMLSGGNTVVTWYADAGSGESVLKFFRASDKNDYNQIGFDGFAFVVNGRFGALQISGTGYPEFFLYDGGFKCKMDSEGGGWADMGAEYRVAGNKVVGARGSAIANATDAATTMARLNDVLAFLRGWGAIAT